MAVFTCEGMSADQWRSQVFIPVFPGMVNRWIVATNRGPVDKPLTDKVKEQIDIEAFRWMAGQGPAFGFSNLPTKQSRELRELPVNVQNWNILGVSDSPLKLAPKGPDGKRLKPLKGFTSLPFKPPIIKADTKFLMLEFLYSGLERQKPWPFGDPQPIVFCPEDADIMPVAVYKPLAPADAAPVKDVRRPVDDLLDRVPNPLRRPLERFDTMTKVVIWGGAAIVLTQLFLLTRDVRGGAKRLMP